MLLICASSLLVMISDPAGQDPMWMRVCDWALTIFFLLEMLLKIVDMGLITDQRSYFRDGWNILDAFVVVISVLALTFSQVRALRTLRVFRSLRPLRLISRTVSTLHRLLHSALTVDC